MTRAIETLETGLVERILGIDIRSLALFRVGLGLILLADLLNRGRDLVAHYTDLGVLPRATLLEGSAHPWHVSLHVASGRPVVVLLLFAVAAAAAVMLLLGWRCRWATAISWLLLISIHNRNPMVLQGGDVLLRLLLFWSLFLPLGAAASVDRALDRSGVDPPQRILSVGSAALLLQMGLVYLFSSILKTDPEWRRDGTALYFALSIDQFATRFGTFLLGFPRLLRAMSFASLGLESVGPWLAFVPFRGGRLRVAVVLAFLSFHLGLMATLELGLFPFICMVGWLPFLPSSFWEWLARRLERRLDATAITIFYDGGCGFCRRMVLILRSLLILPQAQVRVAQEVPAIDQLMREKNSWVVLPDQGPETSRERNSRPENAAPALFRLEALAFVVSRSPIFGWLGRIMGWLVSRNPPNPRRLRTSIRGLLWAAGDRAYRWLASHRPLMGRLTRWLTGRSERWRLRPLGQLIALVSLVVVVAWNIAATPVNWALPAPVRDGARLLRLDQYWNMFAPRPMRDDGWYVIRGVRTDGLEVDLFRNLFHHQAELSWDKPERVARDYPNQRWRKYMMNLWLGKYEAHRPYFADWLCDQWNDDHPDAERVVRLEIHFVLEPTPNPGDSIDSRRILLRGQHCPE